MGFFVANAITMARPPSERSAEYALTPTIREEASHALRFKIDLTSLNHDSLYCTTDRRIPWSWSHRADRVDLGPQAHSEWSSGRQGFPFRYDVRTLEEEKCSVSVSVSAVTFIACELAPSKATIVLVFLRYSQVVTVSVIRRPWNCSKFRCAPGHEPPPTGPPQSMELALYLSRDRTPLDYRWLN